MKHYLRAKDIAPKLSMSLPGIYAAARKGDLPCYRVGTAVLFDEDEVETFLKENRSNCLKTLREYER